MKNTLKSIILFCMVTASLYASDSKKLVIERYRELLLKNSTAPDNQLIAGYMDTLLPDGTWSDIDYTNQSRADWKPSHHLRRILTTSYALAKNSLPDEKRKEYLEKVELALKHWTDERYQCDNWWHNRIGVPRNMRDIIILLGKDLSGEQRKACLEVVNQLKIYKTGANLIWSSELALHHGCMTNDEEQIKHALSTVEGEIVNTKPEGIQQDWSFFQHHERLQIFHYGYVYLDIIVKIGWQVQGTDWDIPDEKKQIITNYILNGIQWMCRGEYTVPSTMDRGASRKGSLYIPYLKTCVDMWKQVDHKNTAVLEYFIEASKAGISAVQGYKHFPDADFSVYHLPESSIFLKTVSTRTLLTETTNSENLMGKPYLNCGDHYVLQSGKEYNNIQPLWDWQHLPGLTVVDDSTKQIQTDFCGGVGREKDGVTAMQYLRKGENGELSVNKLWAFHEGIMICLIGGLKADNLSNPVTSLEQNWLKDDLVYAVNGKVNRPVNSEIIVEHVDWVLHNGIGYIPVNGNLSIHAGEVDGSWGRINIQYDSSKVTGDVFKLQLLHGDNPQASGYLVIPNTDEASMKMWITLPDWQVLQNDDTAQILKFSDGTYMAAVYDPAFCSKLYPCVEKSCIMIWDENNLWITDPTQKGGKTTITYQGKSYPQVLPEKGRAVQIKW